MDDTTRKQQLIEFGRTMLKSESELWQMRQDIAEFHMHRIAGEDARCRGCEKCYGRLCESEILDADLPAFQSWAKIWDSANEHIHRIHWNLALLQSQEDWLDG